MKIVHFYTDPNLTGGPTTYINTIIKSEYLNQFFNFGVVYQLKRLSLLRVNDIRRMVSEIKNAKPDILHVHGLQGEGFVGVYAGRKAGCSRILLTVHGMMNDSFNIGFAKRFFYKNVIEKWTLQHATASYCVCKSAEENPFIRNNARRLLPYVHNCVPQLPDYDRMAVRSELGIKESDVVLISVGRVTEGKGALVLADIIAKDIKGNHRYIIVGDGDRLSYLKKRTAIAQKQDKVLFTGNVRNVGKFLSAADIYISTSYKENLSISLLEAGFYGLPSIVTNVGGNPEIIKNDYNGELFEVGSVNSFYRSLEKLESINLSSYRINARQNIIQRFSCDVFEKRIRSLYVSMMN